MPLLWFVQNKQITSLHQITTAALRSLQGETTGTMRTREIHTELVYTLAATKNITESLRKFGVSDKQESILVAQFDSSPEKARTWRF
jgi:EKC/KEOPS complex subunit CGI121/TPRKB